MQRPAFAATQSRTTSAAGKRHDRKWPKRGNPGTVAAIGAIILLAAWAGGATVYILFNDEALKYLVERQVSITRSYETQAAALQTEIDRLRSVKLIEQERIDRAVGDLARRQAIIETRQSALAALGEPKPGAAKPGEPNPVAETTGSIPRASQPAPAAPAPKPTPLSGTILIAPPTERWTQLESRPLPPLGPVRSARDAETALEARLADLGRGLHRLEVSQSAALNELEVAYDGRKRRVLKVLDELGVRTARFARSRERGDAQNGRPMTVTASGTQSAVGGPFLPLPRISDDPFARQIERIKLTAGAVDALEREISTIPVRRPTARNSEVTSSFGVRLDPFLRQPAMHAGIDFRGETGDPVFAAAGGRVAQAERSGGYGLLVEIDHGNGLATRYAHLSAILVDEGREVAPGELIGRIGSTGRSTGPHLHYEVRLQGEAADPQRFLRAGLRLAEQD